MYVLHSLEFGFHMSSEFGVAPTQYVQLSTDSTVHSSGPSRYSLFFVLYGMIINNGGDWTWTLLYITESQHSVHSHLHGPLYGPLLFGKVYGNGIEMYCFLNLSSPPHTHTLVLSCPVPLLSVSCSVVFC